MEEAGFNIPLSPKKEERGKLEDKEENTIHKILNLRVGERHQPQVRLLIPLCQELCSIIITSRWKGAQAFT